MNRRPSLCVGVLAMNEEKNIRRCIESACFADQVVIVDSGSRDATRQLATEMGAEVYLYPEWKGFAQQRNRLLKHVNTDYIFFLDADEVITLELRKEIINAVESNQNFVWEILWNQVAYGKPLSRMKTTGGIRRLFRVENILRFEGVVHEGAVLRDVNSPVRTFDNKLLHYSRETVYGSLLKLAQYVQLGAVKRDMIGKRGGVLRGVVSGSSSFIRLYFFRRGFLCGTEGFLFCLFVALESFFRYVALKYDSEHNKRQLMKR